MVNTDLLNAARKMDLLELYRELMWIGVEMGSHNVAEDDMRKFTKDGRDLGRLVRELNDLIKP